MGERVVGLAELQKWNSALAREAGEKGLRLRSLQGQAEQLATLRAHNALLQAQVPPSASSWVLPPTPTQPHSSMHLQLRAALVSATPRPLIRSPLASPTTSPTCRLGFANIPLRRTRKLIVTKRSEKGLYV